MTYMSKMQNEDHVPWLDGLRGGAALWVLLSHIQILSGLRSIPVMSWGSLAVDLFILLSGFLMAHHYIKRRAIEPWEQPSTANTVWIRRCVRIAPVYYFILAIAICIGPWLGTFRELIANVWPHTNTPMERYLDRSIENVLAHITFTFGFLPSFAFRTPLPDWSIGLEMQFYLLFPALMLVVSRLGKVSATLLIVGLSALICYALGDFVSQFQMPSFLPMKLYLFFAGIWIAIGREQNKLTTGLKISLLILIVIALFDWNLISLTRIALVLVIYYLMDEGTLPFAAHVRPVISTCRRLLSSRPSRFFGDTSYSLYLVHLLVLLPIAGSLVQLDWYLSFNQYIRFVICAILVIPIAYLISYVLFITVERAGIRLGKQILSSS
jgi:peptidoglycan/LPS O-acetylase OafA/YrhL